MLQTRLGNTAPEVAQLATAGRPCSAPGIPHARLVRPAGVPGAACMRCSEGIREPECLVESVKHRRHSTVQDVAKWFNYITMNLLAAGS